MNDSRQSVPFRARCKDCQWAGWDDPDGNPWHGDALMRVVERHTDNTGHAVDIEYTSADKLSIDLYMMRSFMRTGGQILADRSAPLAMLFCGTCIPDA